MVEVTAMMDYVRDGILNYDKIIFFNLRTEHGMVGRVVQDVVTSPPRKWARLQGENGYLEWQCGYRAGVDAVLGGLSSGQSYEHLFAKTRPDDFIRELRHIEKNLQSTTVDSSISMARGLDTMLVIAAAQKSAIEGRVISIDYSSGYSLNALK